MPKPIYIPPPNNPPSLGDSDFSSKASGFLGWLPTGFTFIRDLGDYLSDEVLQTSGSNANGEFFRFAGGFQVCTNRLAATASGDSVWTFPAQFADASKIAVMLSHVGSANALFTSNRTPSVTSVGFNVWNTAGNRNTATASLIACGTWNS